MRSIGRRARELRGTRESKVSWAEEMQGNDDEGICAHQEQREDGVMW